MHPYSWMQTEGGPGKLDSPIANDIRTNMSIAVTAGTCTATAAMVLTENMQLERQLVL